jgi:hypothetical protein
MQQEKWVKNYVSTHVFTSKKQAISVTGVPVPVYGGTR